MAYLVHHTLNRNGTYTGRKRNPLPFDGNIITDKSQHKKRLANQRFSPFKTNGRKCDLECPIHGIIDSCEIEGAYLGRVLSIFWPKKLHNDFFWKKFFSKFERWIITCFIVAVFRFFTILCFLKNRHNPCSSVRTLDQYIMCYFIDFMLKYLDLQSRNVQFGSVRLLLLTLTSKCLAENEANTPTPNPDFPV